VQKIIFNLLLILIIFSLVSYAESYLSQERYLKDIFPELEEIETKEMYLTQENRGRIEKILGYDILGNSFEFHTAKLEKIDKVYCFIVSEFGKHGLISFAVIISQSGRIEDMAVLESKEIKGAKIAKKRFLRQFSKKSLNDPLKLRKDIDAVSGATVSSKAATKAAKKVLLIWEELFAEAKN